MTWEIMRAVSSGCEWDACLAKPYTRYCNGISPQIDASHDDHNSGGWAGSNRHSRHVNLNLQVDTTCQALEFKGGREGLVYIHMHICILTVYVHMPICIYPHVSPLGSRGDHARCIKCTMMQCFSVCFYLWQFWLKI